MDVTVILENGVTYEQARVAVVSADTAAEMCTELPVALRALADEVAKYAEVPAF